MTTRRGGGQQHLPDEIADKRFYEPTEYGEEADVAKRMKEWGGAIRRKRGEGGES